MSINILNDLTHWEARRQLIARGLEEINPDLICLQEVSLPLNNAEWLRIRLGFPNIFISPKTGEAGRREAIAILSRFPIEEHETLDLGSQSRVAQWIKVKVDGRPLYVVNGHFYWHPGESDGRLKQIELLLASLTALPEDPLQVICGDFNGTPETSAILKMRRYYTSAYFAAHGSEPEFTTPTPLRRSGWIMLRTLIHFIREVSIKEIRPNWHGTLDYIFINQKLRVLDCQLVLNRPDAHDPRLYPSDHFGLSATLEIIE